MTLPLSAVKSSASINFYRSKGNFFFLEDINYEFSFLPLFSLALIAQTVSVRTKVQLLISWLLSWKSRYTLSSLSKISSVFEITYRYAIRICANVRPFTVFEPLRLTPLAFDDSWKQSVNLKLPDHSKETLWLFFIIRGEWFWSLQRTMRRLFQQ